MGEGFAAPGRLTLTGDLLSLMAVVMGRDHRTVRSTALKRAPPEKVLSSADHIGGDSAAAVLPDG
jgi:hypothetical protein